MCIRDRDTTKPAESKAEESEAANEDSNKDDAATDELAKVSATDQEEEK